MKKFKSFKRTLVISFVIVALVPLFSMSMEYFRYISSSTREKIEEYTLGNLKIASELLDNNMSIYSNIINFIAENEDVQAIIKKDKTIDTKKDFGDTQKLYTITRSIMASHPVGIPIHLVNNYKLSRFSTTNYYVPLYADGRGNLYESMLSADSQVVKQVHRRVDGKEAMDTVMAMGRTIVDKESQEVIGYVIADIYDSYIASIIDNIYITGESNIYIVDPKGYIITDRKNKNETGFKFNEEIFNKLSEDSGQLKADIDGVSYNIYYRTAQKSDIILLELIPESYFLIEVKESLSVIFFVIASVIILSTLIVYILSSKISGPINELSEAMKKVEQGDRSVIVSFEGEDQLGQLAVSYNKMIKRINRLIDEDYNKQLMLKQSELKALKAQINPHFLYNSLSSISWMAKLGYKEELSDMATALSKFFRYSISSTGDTVSIKQEIEQVKNYIMIQKMRYRDKFEAEVNVDEELYNYKILKLILQPLIENSLIHGIEQKLDSGKLIIEGYLDNQSIIFDIKDNGVGFGNSKSKGEGIGLANVSRRIMLHYGSDYGIKNFREHGYTVVRVTIPKEVHTNVQGNNS